MNQSPTAIITGAAGGIGEATARLLASRGYRLLLVDHEADALEQVRKELRDAGTDVDALEADVSKETEVRGYLEHAKRTLGRIDGFFNNAGIIGPLTSIVNYPTDQFDKVIAVNLRGVFLGMKYVLPEMYAQKSGAVVNTASVAGQVGHLLHGAYGASKHAVIGLTRIAAGESGPHGVRVNALAPGPIQTNMISQVEAMKSPENADLERQRFLGIIPAQRYGTPDEVGRTVAFLIGPESEYINGTIVNVDGGFAALR